MASDTPGPWWQHEDREATGCLFQNRLKGTAGRRRCRTISLFAGEWCTMKIKLLVACAVVETAIIITLVSLMVHRPQQHHFELIPNTSMTEAFDTVTGQRCWTDYQSQFDDQHRPATPKSSSKSSGGIDWDALEAQAQAQSGAKPTSNSIDWDALEAQALGKPTLPACRDLTK